MPASKIVNEDEVIRWFNDGLTYEEMSRRYREQYHLEMTPSAWGNFRRRKGLVRRTVRDVDVIPWNNVREEHRYKFPVRMLRLEARVRAGQPLREEDQRKWESWKRFLAEDNVVVSYEPDEHPEDGFVYRRRRPEDGDDIVRQPLVAARRHATE